MHSAHSQDVRHAGVGEQLARLTVEKRAIAEQYGYQEIDGGAVERSLLDESLDLVAQVESHAGESRCMAVDADFVSGAPCGIAYPLASHGRRISFREYVGGVFDRFEMQRDDDVVVDTGAYRVAVQPNLEVYGRHGVPVRHNQPPDLDNGAVAGRGLRQASYRTVGRVEP